MSRGYYDLGLFPGAIPVDSLPVWFFSGCVTSGEFSDLSAPQLFHLCYGGSNSICLVGQREDLMRQDVYGEISTIKQLVLGMDMALISICSALIVCGHLF